MQIIVLCLMIMKLQVCKSTGSAGFKIGPIIISSLSCQLKSLFEIVKMVLNKVGLIWIFLFVKQVYYNISHFHQNRLSIAFHLEFNTAYNSSTAIIALLTGNSYLYRTVTCYPGALCNVTYDIPTSCQEAFTALTQQMNQWDNTTSCPGQCEQRYFLSPKPGPPLSAVTLEGTGETCDKCPCGQKCFYVHKETNDRFVKGMHCIIRT